MQSGFNSSSMRAIYIIASLILLLACASGLFFLSPFLTQYYRFQHKSDTYYIALTKACDSLIANYPLGTNRYAELSIGNASLPKIITDLQPLKIKISSNCVWILHGGSIEFGITWEKAEGYRTLGP